MSGMSPTAEEPYVGMRIPEQLRETTSAQLFLFSAATANPHRIHYDLPYAHEEGFAGVVVQSHLHACVLADAALQAFGPGAALRSLSWQNRAPAFAGDALVITGEVTAVRLEGASVLVAISLEEHRGADLCVRGEATVCMAPKRPGKAGKS